jgi:hypothetical protein
MVQVDNVVARPTRNPSSEYQTHYAREGPASLESQGGYAPDRPAELLIGRHEVAGFPVYEVEDVTSSHQLAAHVQYVPRQPPSGGWAVVGYEQLHRSLIQLSDALVVKGQSRQDKVKDMASGRSPDLRR